MIALGFKKCENDRYSQHKAGEQLLSEMLSQLCGVDEPKITRLQNGKPVSEDAVFSLSHSGCYAGVAVVTDFLPQNSDYIIIDSKGKNIGFDIEVLVINDERYKKIAERYFSNKENRFLEGCDNYSLEFLKLWTQKESFIKCSGDGLKAIRTPLPSEGFVTGEKIIDGHTVVFSVYAK